MSELIASIIGWLFAHPEVIFPAGGLWVFLLVWGRRLQAVGAPGVARNLSGIALVWGVAIYTVKNWPTAWRILRAVGLAVAAVGWLGVWMLAPHMRGTLLLPVALGVFVATVLGVGRMTNWEAPTVANLRAASHRSRVSKMLTEALAFFAPGDQRLPVALTHDGTASIAAHLKIHPGGSVYDLRDHGADGSIVGAVNRTAERHGLPSDWQLAHIEPNQVGGHADLVLATASTLGDPRDYPGPSSLDPTAPAVIGWTITDQPQTVRLAGGHVLIGGLTGAGKSVTLRNIIAECAPRPNVALVLGDPKMTEFGVWPKRASSVALGVPAVRRQIGDLAGLMQARMDALANADGYATQAAVDEFPLVVFVLDEIAEVTKGREGQRSATQLHTIATLGRALNVVLVAATQRPSTGVIPADLRDNIPTRLAHAMIDGTATEMILGSQKAKAHELPMGTPGAGFAGRDDSRDFTRFRSFWLSPERAAAIAEDTAHLRVDLEGIDRRYTTKLDSPEETK